MTQQELRAIFKAITAEHKGFDVSPERAAMWLSAFGKYPADIVLKAVQNHLLSSPYEPKIAHINTLIAELATPEAERLTAMEAFGMVLTAVARYGWPSEQAALQSLPEHVANIVRGMGWLAICESENVDVLRGQFRMAYEAQEARAKIDRIRRALPASSRALLEASSSPAPASAVGELVSGILARK